MRYVSKVSASRREPNSHETSKPRALSCRWARGPRRKRAVRRQPSTGVVSAANHQDYLGLQCHIEPAHCEGGSLIRSVCGATAAKATPGLGQLRRLESAACHGSQRRAGGAWCVHRRIATPWQVQRRCISVAALPNPSLKRSANGLPPGPVLGAQHFPPPGPGGKPSSPA